MKTPIKSIEHYTTISGEVVAYLSKHGLEPLFTDNIHHFKTYHYDSSHKIFNTINVLYSNINNTRDSVLSSNLKKPPITGFSTVGEEVVLFLQGFNINPVYKHKKYGVWVYHYENSHKLLTLLAMFYSETDE